MHFHLFHTVVPAITDTVLEKSDSERGMSVIVEHAQLCGFSVVAVCPQAQAFTMKKLQVWSCSIIWHKKPCHWPS